MKRDEFDLFDDEWREFGNEWDDVPKYCSTKNWKAIAISGGVVAAVAVAIGCVLWFGPAVPDAPEVDVPAEQQARQERPPRTPRSKDALRKETRKAFAAKERQQPIDDATRRSLHAFFDRFTKAVREKDRFAIAESFDGRRIVEELIAQGLPRREVRDIDRAARTLVSSIARSVTEVPGNWEFQGCRIRMIKRGESNADLLLYLRVPADDTFVKTRVWMSRTHGRWRLYDTESLEVGLRMSRIMFGIMHSLSNAPKKAEVIRRQVMTMRRLVGAIGNGDTLALQAIVNPANLDHLPDDLKSMLPLARIVLKADDEQWEDILPLCDQALKLNPEMCCIHLWRATAFNQLERFAEAETSARRFLHELGDDVDAYLSLATALAGQNKNNAARDALRKGLLDDPNSTDCLTALAALLDDDQKSEVGRYFSKMPLCKKLFPTVAIELIDEEDFAALDEILKAYRKIEPDDPRLACFQSELEYHREEFEQAMKTAQPGLRTIPDKELRRRCMNAYLNAAYRLKKLVEAYREVDDLDPEYAFSFISAGLVRDLRIRELEQLLAVHRKRFPDYINRDRIDGEIDYVHSRWEQAAEKLRKALKWKNDPEEQEGIRRRVENAETYVGKFVEAYNEFGPSQKRFRRIAPLIIRKKYAPSLQSLIAAHRRRFPDDVWLTYHTARLKSLNGDVAGALRLLEAAVPELKVEEDRSSFLDLYHQLAYRAGRWQETLNTSPAQGESFRWFAGRLMRAKLWGELEKLIQAYAPNGRDDLNVEYYRGELARERKQLDKAETLLRAAWSKAKSKKDRLRYGFALVNVMRERGRGLEAYRSVPPRDVTFRRVAAYFADATDAGSLETLLNEHARENPDEPSIRPWKIRLACLRGEDETALRLIREAEENAKTRRQKFELWDAYLNLMIARSKAVEAYRQAGDKRFAFSQLAWRLKRKKDFKTLRTLLDLYYGKRPKDGGYHQFLAQIAEVEEDWEQAVGHYRDAFKAAKSGEVPWAVRSRFIVACEKAGRPLDAYRDGKSVDHTGRMLAGMFIRQKQPDRLEKLIALHAGQHADDPFLWLWRAELSMLRKDYKSVVATINSHRGQLLNNQLTVWRAELLLVSALLQLNQIDKAAQVGSSRKTLWRNARAEALIAAARNDVPAFRETLGYLVDRRDYTLEQLYDDEQLGPALRRPEFAALRTQYPPPAEPAKAGSSQTPGK